MIVCCWRSIETVTMSVTVHIASDAVKLDAPSITQANAWEYHVPDPLFRDLRRRASAMLA